MPSIKKLFKNPAKIIWVLDKLKLGKLFSDRAYLKMKYRACFGKKLDLKNPKTFNEKLQWLKLYDRNPQYTKLVDKYAVKSYVAEKIGQEFVIPTLGVWDSVEEIDFDALPDRFVLKCTHDSGGLVICRDKSKLNIEQAKKKLNRALKTEFYSVAREWPYKHVKPRVIAEQYMQDGESLELKDYKFYCFSGEPRFLYLSSGLSNYETARISYVSLGWEKMPVKRSDFSEFCELPPRPENFEKMLEFSRVLSKDVPFLRVDFYEINGAIYFSELTFFPGGGFTLLEPSEYDSKIGEWLILPRND